MFWSSTLACTYNYISIIIQNEVGKKTVQNKQLREFILLHAMVLKSDNTIREKLKFLWYA